ncbi:hypothetical protein NC653_033180 [Populus alba x Populus x berolinensis]|uniref:Uncharacterized protein n=1 Tax=Populus alba x Populus x berolinensis TaxID=444605 RepID=A0AAD6Q017_9ROSI|nr:hypothetical protein NC653_033180 [Populus alba x Populus x berolinensis]
MLVQDETMREVSPVNQINKDRKTLHIKSSYTNCCAT